MVADSNEQDARWFDEVYRSSYLAVVRYVYRRANDRALAEELTQEVFYVAWRRRHETPKVTLPWLYAVARRLLLNEWRARRNKPVLVNLTVASAAATDSPCESVPAIVDIYTAMAGLQECDREVLQLVGWEQLTVKEAAEVMGCSRVAAATRLMRARRRLAAALEPGSTYRPDKSADTIALTREAKAHA